VGSSGAADDQVDGEKLVVDGVAVEEVEKHLHGDFAEAELRLVNGGERWGDIAGEVHVVVTDEGEVAGDLDAEFAAGEEGADGDEVVIAEDGSDAGVEESGEEGLSFDDVVFGMEAVGGNGARPGGVGGDAGGVEGGMVAAEAALVGLVAVIDTEVADPAVTEVEEVVESLAGAVEVVGIHGEEARGVGFGLLVDEDSGEVNLGEALDVGAADLGGGGDDAIDAAAVKSFDDFEFALGVVMGDGEEDGDTGGLGDGLDAAHDAPDEGVGNRGDDEADGIGALAFERLGDSIGRIAHLGGELLDAGAHFGGDEGGIMEGAGDGGVGDAGGGGDILDRNGTAGHRMCPDGNLGRHG
jgi:hypothetical protein